MSSESQAAPETFLEANRAHFDGIAHQYDDRPQAIKRARRTALKMREAYDFDEDYTTVMEYACGTGLVSRELSPYAKRIVGVDISQGMVDQFNLRVSNQGIPAEEMQAFCVELKGNPGELGDERFDVVVCSAAYHHFTDIDGVTRILAHFLKPGGALLVVDIEQRHGDDTRGHGHEYGHGRGHGGHSHTHWHGADARDDHAHAHEHRHSDGHGHVRDSHEDQPIIPKEYHHIVPHHGGLSEMAIRKAFQGARLESFSFKGVEDIIFARNNAKLFLAKGIKPAV